MAAPDTLLFEQLKKGDEKAFVALYNRHKTEFASWLQNKFKLSRDESLEIFQLTMVTFYENVINNKIPALTSTLKTYLYAIGKNKALEFFRKNKKTHPMGISAGTEPETLLFDIEEESDIADEEHRYNTMRVSLEKLGDPCAQIIIFFYFKNMPLIEIKERFGYKTEQSVKSQKFKCMERLRSIYFELYKSIE